MRDICTVGIWMAKINDPKKLQFNILCSLLKPVLRHCIRNSQSIHDVTKAAKKVLVDLAEEEIASAGGKVNLSRVSVMTGIYRDEVKRLLSKEEQQEIEQKSVLSRIMGTWRHHANFTTKGGEPRVLSYIGESSDFAKLVYSVSKNLRPGAALFELKRLRYVEETSRGLKLIKELRGGFERDPQGGYDLLSRDMATLIDAVEENLVRAKEPSNLHIRTEYDNVSKKNLLKIRRWLVTEGKAFHRKARKYISQFDKDVNPELQADEGGGRVVVSAFSLAELEEETE